MSHRHRLAARLTPGEEPSVRALLDGGPMTAASQILAIPEGTPIPPGYRAPASASADHL